MIRINLLPVREIKARLRLRRQVGLFAASLVVLALALTGLGLGQGRRIDGLNNEIHALEAKRNSFRPILRQIKKLQQDKKILRTKLQAIERLKVGSQLTVRVLDEIANRTPVSRMWLTSLKLAGDHLSLTGVALDNATIAQYMQQLEASPFFTNTDLASSAQTVVAGQKLKSFVLGLRVVPPQPAAARTDSGAAKAKNR